MNFHQANTACRKTIRRRPSNAFLSRDESPRLFNPLAAKVSQIRHVRVIGRFDLMGWRGPAGEGQNSKSRRALS